MKELRSRIMTLAFALLWGWVGSKSTPTRQRRCLADVRMRNAFCCHGSTQPTLQPKQQQGGSACAMHAGSAACSGSWSRCAVTLGLMKVTCRGEYACGSGCCEGAGCTRTAAADCQLREVGAAAGAERHVLRVRMACVRLMRVLQEVEGARGPARNV